MALTLRLLGSHLAHKILKQGYQVIVLKRRSRLKIMAK